MKLSTIQLPRGRLVVCKGCPTVECTCMTDLEDALLDNSDRLIRATGRFHITKALGWIRARRKEQEKRK